MRRFLQVFSLFAVGASAVCADTFRDDFTGGLIDKSAWCECQMDKNFPVRVGKNPAGTILIDADSRDVGGNNCQWDKVVECVRPNAQALAADSDIDEIEDLTASIFGQFARERANKGLMSLLRPSGVTYCSGLVQDAANVAYDAEELIKGEPQPKSCIQRQELRLFSDLRSFALKPSSYTIRFRMPAKEEIQDRVHSLRWVLAQWKQTKLAERYESSDNLMFKSQSPFVAVRFDDAVLHVTVQDEYWRCLIASAEHEVWPALERNDGPIPYKNCVWTGREDYTGPKPEHSLHLVHHTSPVLENVAGQFTTLRFDIVAGPSGEVVLWQNDTKIATVTGHLGWALEKPGKSKIKFKFGQYRDYMADSHAMEIDFVEISD